MTHQDPERTQRIPATTIGQSHHGPATGHHPVAPSGTDSGTTFPPGPRTPAPPWPTPPPGATASPVLTDASPAVPARGRGGMSGRWIAAALGAAVVLVGATAAVTLAVAGGGSTPPAAPGPAIAAAHPTTGAPAPGHGGQPTVDALISGYVNAVDNAQGEAVSQFLCGGTGPGPDTAVGWSWVFVMLHEQLQPGPQQTVQSRTVIPLTVLARGQQSGSYLAVLDHRSSGWCLLGLDE